MKNKKICTINKAHPKRIINLIGQIGAVKSPIVPSYVFLTQAFLNKGTVAKNICSIK
jgi:hypothetical protein